MSLSIPELHADVKPMQISIKTPLCSIALDQHDICNLQVGTPLCSIALDQHDICNLQVGSSVFYEDDNNILVLDILLNITVTRVLDDI